MPPVKTITFSLDFISPYAYLAFEQLPQALEGLSYSVEYRPILFAGLLKHHGQLGPAEIPGKREWTYRQVLWQAHVHGIAMQMPAVHPFNPLGLLRLALACGPNRHVCETIFRHVWRGGADAADPARLQALHATLAPALDPASDGVKDALKQATARAVEAGLFGVPTFTVDGRQFWGFDALPMLRAALEGDPWIAAHWDAAAQPANGLVRPARG